MHARSGGVYEIVSGSRRSSRYATLARYLQMGLMQGKIEGDTFIVMDAFALPVEGTETRVNAASEANEYMVQYVETAQKVSSISILHKWETKASTGRTEGECRGLVSFASRLRLLAFGYRRHDPTH